MAIRDRAAYVSFHLEEAISHSNDTALIRLLVRHRGSDVLSAAQDILTNRTGRSLIEKIKSLPKGSYQHCMLIIAGHETSYSPVLGSTIDLDSECDPSEVKSPSLTETSFESGLCIISPELPPSDMESSVNPPPQFIIDKLTTPATSDNESLVASKSITLQSEINLIYTSIIQCDPCKYNQKEMILIDLFVNIAVNYILASFISGKSPTEAFDAAYSFKSKYGVNIYDNIDQEENIWFNALIQSLCTERSQFEAECIADALVHILLSFIS